MVRPSSRPPVGGARKPLAIRLKEGTRVCVLLPRDGRWFGGAVKKYDTKKALHTIVNDFGDAKRVDLRTVQWRLEGIEDCTDADIENALDRGKRWHKSQRAEFIDSMKCPMLSPREAHCRRQGDGAAAAAWETSRLRTRKDSRDWYSSSEGESAENGGVVSGEEDEEFTDDNGNFADSDPPKLIELHSLNDEVATSSFTHDPGHLDFQLSVKGDVGDDLDTKLSNHGCRKRALGRSEFPVLKRPVGRPPKVRKGLAAIKYAQDIAAGAINQMARDKLRNFNVIPSSIPFVEELQLIFGISRRLKVDRQKMLSCEGTELAAHVLTGCRMGGRTDEASASESRLPPPCPQLRGTEIENSGSPAGCSALVAAESSPLKATLSAGLLRDDWSRGFQSSLVA